MIFARLFFAFFKIGVFGFGGGLAIISLIYQSIQQFQSVSPEQFANIIAITQATPGPVAINTATYIGYDAEGILGAFVATAGVVVPAFIIIWSVGSLISRNKENPYLLGAIKGLRPATVAMIAASAITVAKPAFITKHALGANIAALHAILPGNVDIISMLICIATVIAVGKYGKSAIKVLIVMGIIGAILGV